MNSTSREIRRLNIKSFLIDVVFGVVTAAELTCFLLFGQRASAALCCCTLLHFLFVLLPSLCLEVCLSFVICLNIYLPFIQLLFEQDTSVFYLNFHLSFEMYYNIPRLESKLLCL